MECETLAAGGMTIRRGETKPEDVDNVIRKKGGTIIRNSGRTATLGITSDNPPPPQHPRTSISVLFKFFNLPLLSGGGFNALLATQSESTGHRMSINMNVHRTMKGRSSVSRPVLPLFQGEMLSKCWPTTRAPMVTVP